MRDSDGFPLEALGYGKWMEWIAWGYGVFEWIASGYGYGYGVDMDLDMVMRCGKKLYYIHAWD